MSDTNEMNSDINHETNGTISMAVHPYGALESDKAKHFLTASIFSLPIEGMVEYLENGGDATIVDFNGNTLAHVYPHLSEELSERGCDVNRLNNAGYSPLMTAIENNAPLWNYHAKMSDPSLAKLVELTSQENLNRVYPNGETVLTSYLSKISMVLDEHEDGEILPVLLRQGANPNVPNAKGQTPLDCCCASNKDVVVAMMIPYGVNLDSKKENGKTLLMEAIEQKDEKLARLLLKNGADVKAKDNDGDTVLHHAARAGLTELVPVLVKAGAYAHSRNNEGKQPHQYAKGIAHEYLKVLALSCAGDYQFHSGYVYNLMPQKIASQPVAGQTPAHDNQNTIK